jgi:hypothetical protein
LFAGVGHSQEGNYPSVSLWEPHTLLGEELEIPVYKECL